MRKKLKNEIGITLIALVITIIILLILAGISISTLIGSELFENAKKSKEEIRGASVEEQKELWQMNKEMNKYDNNENDKTLEELLDELENQKLITENEKISIKETGQVMIGSRTIIFETDLKQETEWSMKDGVISNGTNNLEVGQIVYLAQNFDEDSVEQVEYITKIGKQCFRLKDYKDGFYVMGLEDGMLKLVSKGLIFDKDGKYYKTNKSYDGLLKTSEDLDNICGLFKKLDGVELSRCINLNDINSITGFKEKNLVFNNYSTNAGYMKNFDIYWQGTNYIKGILTSNGSSSAGGGEDGYKEFLYYNINNDEFEILQRPQNLGKDETSFICNLTSTSLNYDLYTLEIDYSKECICEPERGFI